MSCIITQTDLNGRSLAELRTLLHRLQTLAAAAPTGSDEQRQALASLETVSRTIRQRQQNLTPHF